MKQQTNGSYSGIHRILHGAIGMLMIVLFSTGFLRMEWMSKKNIINAINHNTHSLVSAVDAKAIAKEILSPMWQWHVLAAYVITFVFLARIIYMFARGIKFPDPFRKQQLLKNRIQGITYMLFYIFLFTTIVTGLYLKLGNTEWKAPMEKIHKLAIYWFPIFILFHIIGITVGEVTTRKGIVSRMISG